LKFQNELRELRRKLSPEWHAKLDEIEETVLHPEKNQTDRSYTYRKV